MEYTNDRVNTFLGLNNKMNPASAEFREGMASRSLNCRIDQYGLWSARPALVAESGKPSLLATGTTNAKHFKFLAVEGTSRIISELADNDSCDTGTNGYLYLTTQSGAIKYFTATTNSTVTAFTPPATITAADQSGDTRGQSGTYYYMCTYYDDTRKRESLPSPIADIEVDTDTDGHVRLTVPGPAEGISTRVYRSLRTSATDNEYNATNIFYYLGEVDYVSGSATLTFDDYLHDDDINRSQYEGRGSAPPTAIDYVVSYNNRMLYFKDSTLWWSSAGRPEEVAQEYTLTYQTDSSTVVSKPKLTNGYGEAKYEIAELAGQKVVGAKKFGNRLWVWTDAMTGYLEANRVEGYKFKVARQGIGLVSDKCLAHSPYGVFGADRIGTWLLDNQFVLKRLSNDVIDIESGTDTTLTQAKITASCGIWVPGLNEYWWCLYIPGETPSNYVQIIYQADRGVFVGPYTHPITGGCNIVNAAAGLQAYVTGDKYVSTTASDTTVAQTLEFWMGQSSPTVVKDKLEVEVVHSKLPTAAVGLSVYQNSITATTSITPQTVSYTASTGKVKSVGSGRYFKIALTLPAAGAPVANINYKFNAIGWNDDGR